MKSFLQSLILPLPLFQEGQLSITSERMCSITGKSLRGLNLPRISVSRLAVRLDMTVTVLIRLLNSLKYGIVEHTVKPV